MGKAPHDAYIQDAAFNLTECFFPQNGHSVVPNPCTPKLLPHRRQVALGVASCTVLSREDILPFKLCSSICLAVVAAWRSRSSFPARISWSRCWSSAFFSILATTRACSSWSVAWSFALPIELSESSTPHHNVHVTYLVQWLCSFPLSQLPALPHAPSATARSPR